MYCSKCGNDVANGLTYCDICGADLTSDEFGFDEVSPAKDSGKGLGIASLIIGIVSFTCINPFGWLTPIVGLILGIFGNKKSNETGNKNTLAKVGTILNIIALVIGIVGTVTIILLYGAGFIIALSNGSL